MATIALGRVFGLRITAQPSGVAAAALMVGLFTVVAVGLLQLSWGTALVIGLAATAIHHVSELLHQCGHAYFAARIGYPMVGIEFYMGVARTVYPADEPTLPPTTHIFRALGGPAFSALIAMVCGLLQFALFGNVPTLVWYLLLFAMADNLVVFTLAAFLPLGFTDGSSILRNLKVMRGKK